MAKKFIPERYENLEVVDINQKGKGVVKSEDGKVIFVSGVVPGDQICVETFKERRGYFEAKLVEINRPSDERATPVCSHFGTCGGCKWQNLTYEAQLRFKQKEITHNLTHMSGMALPEIEKIIPASKNYFYRNKMEYSFSSQRWLTSQEIMDKTSEIEKRGLGFHKAGMWDKVVDIKECHLQPDPANKIRNFIKTFALKKNFEFFNPKTRSGFLRTLMIRNSNMDEFMVLIQFYKEDKPKREAIMEAILEKFDIKSLLYCINGKANDTLYDQEIFCYHGTDFIVEDMEGLKFKINSKSFFQTNTEQAYELYKITREFAALKVSEVVYDLYTGTGTIAQFVAKDCKKVIGIESVPDAVHAAKINAKENGIDNAYFEVGDMRKVFNPKFINQYGQADVVITDPPRNGMHPEVIQQLLALSPKKIVYVSCNNATQARDLNLMKEHYRMTRTKAIDMFPQTQHVENVVLLKKI